jgi:hypothetical protein
MTLAFEKQVAKLDDAVLLESKIAPRLALRTRRSNLGLKFRSCRRRHRPIGWQARLGASGLGLFCLAAAVLFHQNFAVRNELLHFEKDLAIAGGIFVLVVRGPGAWSAGVLFLRATKVAAATA